MNGWALSHLSITRVVVIIVIIVIIIIIEKQKSRRGMKWYNFTGSQLKCRL